MLLLWHCGGVHSDIDIENLVLLYHTVTQYIVPTITLNIGWFIQIYYLI